MSWNHVVLEGYCFCKKDEFIDVPCCNTKPGFTTIKCLRDENDKRCPYFSYCPAASCVVLTDNKGNDAACETFWIDEDDSVMNT